VNLASQFGLKVKHMRKQNKTNMCKKELSDFVRSNFNVILDSIDWFIVSYDSANCFIWLS